MRRFVRIGECLLLFHAKKCIVFGFWHTERVYNLDYQKQFLFIPVFRSHGIHIEIHPAEAADKI